MLAEADSDGDTQWDGEVSNEESNCDLQGARLWQG